MSYFMLLPPCKEVFCFILLQKLGALLHKSMYNFTAKIFLGLVEGL